MNSISSLGPGFSIGSRAIGKGQPCFVIAEVAQAHDGSLGNAHAYIDIAADCGADAIKFQTHIASAESTPREPWRVKFSKQDRTRFDYWTRMEFTEEQWVGLREHAVQRGIEFLSSPFSPQAVDLLARLGMQAWKIASGEVNNLPLIARIAAHRQPVLLSSGMSGYSELDRAVEQCRAALAPVALFQCTTAYPCPPEKVGLDQLAKLAERYQCPVGISDHSGTIFPGLAAATLGASFIEVHITYSRSAFGPDVPASLTPDELATLVRGVRFIDRMHLSPVDKEALAAATLPMRSIFGKSIVAAFNLPAGTVLSEANLALKKPGDGLPPGKLPEMFGRRLRVAVQQDQIITESCIE
jgi:N-acetylneuraminate synthase